MAILNALLLNPPALPKPSVLKPLLFLSTLIRVSPPSHNFEYHLYTEDLTFDLSDLFTQPSTLLINFPTQYFTRMFKRHFKLNVAQMERSTYLTPV